MSLLIIGSARLMNIATMQADKCMPPDSLVDKVKFVGFVQQEELPKIYGISNCAVLGTSKRKHQETLPLFLLEALSSGVPVIAPANGAIPEVIRQDKEGIILDAEYEMSEMLAAMRRMVEEREAWAARANDISDAIRKDFSWERVAGEVTDKIKKSWEKIECLYQRKKPFSFHITIFLLLSVESWLFPAGGFRILIRINLKS